MQRDDFSQFRQLLTDVMAYYGKDVSSFMLDLWWNACAAFDLEQVAKAMQRHATDPEHGQFAPKVADIARILSGTATDRAALAWGNVHEAMSSVGAYTDAVFDDTAVHAVIADLGGWPKVCRTELKELSYLQHRFQEAYRAYTGRSQFDYPRVLMGDRSPDAEFAKRGLPPPRPALIGDRAKAKEVYRLGSTAGKTAISFTPIAALEASIKPVLPNRLEAAA